MPLEVYSSNEALEIARANKAFRGWPKRNDDNRVEPVALPDFKPAFSLSVGEKLFTIGSCFARHIEATLQRLGFEFVVRRLSADPLFSGDVNVNVLNKYTPNSILNELQWALEPERGPYPDPIGYLELGPDQWIDVNMHQAPAVPLEIARRRRQLALENAWSVKECRVVVITPGLIEAWWDAEAKYYVNETPPVSFMKKHPDRFQLHVLTYDEVVRAFAEIHALLSRHLRPDFWILSTVSPVPLSTTFRNDDVMVANTYSKSVLRAATDEFRSRYRNVGYFPSYESVILSHRDIAWRDDLIHPTHEIIEVNMFRMVERYIEAPNEAVTGILSTKLRKTDSGVLKPFAAELEMLNREVRKLKSLKRYACHRCSCLRQGRRNSSSRGKRVHAISARFWSATAF